MGAPLRIHTDGDQDQGRVVYEMTPDQRSQIVDEVVARVVASLERMLSLQTEQPLTVKAAAKFLSIEPQALTQRISRGTIRSYKNGKTRYLFASEINKDIRSQKK